MAGRPLHHPADQWTETDQEIIETLLLADSSSAARTAQPPTGGFVRASAPPTAHGGASPAVYWVPAQPGPVGYVPVANAHLVEQQRLHAELQELASEEERKAKHREVQRRFVQRKKEQMERVRREAATLEKRHAYLQLSMEQLTLEKENSELEEKFAGGEALCPTNEQIDGVLEEDCCAAQRSFVPISNDEFSELLKETMECVGDTVIKDTRKLDDGSRVHVMGWTGRRVVERGTAENALMRFEISKDFPRTQPDDLANRAWERISNPHGYRKFFGSSVLMKVVILQRVNDDSVILYMTIFNPQTAAVHHSVDLLCRIHRNEEILIISRGLSMPSVQDSLRDSSGWCRSLNVLGFSSPKQPASRPTRQEKTCAFRYNCCIQGTSEANLRYWLMEILFVMVRFENILVAPLFALAAP